MININKIDNKQYTLQELEVGAYGLNKEIPIVLDSYVDGDIIEDYLIEVFETGKKEVYSV